MNVGLSPAVLDASTRVMQTRRALRCLVRAVAGESFDRNAAWHCQSIGARYVAIACQINMPFSAMIALTRITAITTTLRLLANSPINLRLLV